MAISMAISIFATLLCYLFQAVTAQVVPGFWVSPAYQWTFQYPLPIPPTAQVLYSANVNGQQINYYELEIKPFQRQVYPNLGPANLIGYNGMAPGPTFVTKRGVQAIVRVTNHGNTTASTHLHGSPTRSPWDGWADDLVPIGYFKDYYYPNYQTSRTLWYHDHATSHTAPDAYFGQNGVWIIAADDDATLGLPSGKYDTSLVIQDTRYLPSGDRFDPSSEKINFFGDLIEVNGRPWPFYAVEPRKYRLRFLNSALSRPFQLHLQSDDTGQDQPLMVIASDGGFFHNPVVTQSLYLSMGERYEVIVDFGGMAGKNLTLKNELNIFGVQDYAQTDLVMRFVVGNTVTDQSNNGRVPWVINVEQPPQPRNRNTIDHVFNFQRSFSTWTINGVDYNETAARVLARPPQGTVENWQLRYASGPGVHPVHIHLIEYKVVSRTGGTRGVEPYEAAGMKDVVLLAPGEVVNVVAQYGPWNGQYMFHCHNLVHEDDEMMDVFNVTLLEQLGYSDWARFDDPMDPRFKPTQSLPQYYAPSSVTGTLIPSLGSLDAYRDYALVSSELSSYYQTHTDGESTTSAFSTAAPDPTTVLTSVIGSVGSGIGVTGVSTSISVSSSSSASPTITTGPSITTLPNGGSGRSTTANNGGLLGGLLSIIL